MGTTGFGSNMWRAWKLSLLFIQEKAGKLKINYFSWTWELRANHNPQIWRDRCIQRCIATKSYLARTDAAGGVDWKEHFHGNFDELLLAERD